MQNENYKLPFKSFLGVKTVKYRIVKDAYLGYECQIWRFWFPFWIEIGFTNTFRTLERAINFIEGSNKPVILN